MKIAVFYELESGGARRGAHEFSQCLMKLGHQIDLFTVEEQKRPDAQRYFTSVHSYPFHAVRWNGNNWKSRLYRDTVELWNLWKIHVQIARDIETHEYDVAFIHPSKYTQAPFLLSLLKIPKLYYCQEPLRMVYEKLLDIPQSLSFGKKIYEYIVRYIRKEIDRVNLRSADQIFANSIYTQTNIFNAYGLHSSVCHMGVDTRRFYPSTEKSVDILYIGTREKEEGLPLLEQALSHMDTKPRVKFLIRGENWTKDDTVLRDTYSSARITVCFGYNEPFGLIPLEAMACESVPVALREGGYQDSVQDGVTGVLVPRDAKIIGKTISNLLSNPRKLNKMSTTGRNEMKAHWQWSAGAKEILKSLIQLQHAGPTNHF